MKKTSEHSLPVVLVTGGSRGLGRGIAEHLAREGCSLAIGYRSNREAAERTVTECEKVRKTDGQEFLPVQGHIGRSEDRRRLVSDTLSSLGRIDALVNNAGMAPRERADILRATEESFREVVQANLEGPYFLTQEVANYWIDKRPAVLLPSGFTVIFITSISAETASVSRGEYCVSKAGLSMAAQLWAARLADEGICVLEIRPGIMDTDMTAKVRDRYTDLIRDGLVPQRRWGTADDVGRAVASVIRGDFPFSAGTVIDVDGGFHLRRL
jgi:NAD(P)-dependent dehydrogenase (short-subunit alcohol dehydrogenase family)